jgi:hypothetical protein
VGCWAKGEIDSHGAKYCWYHFDMNEKRGNGSGPEVTDKPSDKDEKEEHSKVCESGGCTSKGRVFSEGRMWCKAHYEEGVELNKAMGLVSDEESDTEQRGKDKHESAAPKKPAKEKKKKAAKASMPTVRLAGIEKGEIVGMVNYVRVTESGIWDGAESRGSDYFRADDLRGPTANTTLQKSKHPAFVATTRRYNEVIELSKTKLADAFLNCLVFPLRVSFRPVMTEKKLVEQLEEIDGDDTDLTKFDGPVRVAKYCMDLPIRTMDCVMKTPNSSLGYSLVDDLNKGTTDANIRTVNHQNLVQFVFKGKLYKLKGSKFVDDDLIKVD